MGSIVDDLEQRIRALSRAQKTELVRAMLADLDDAVDSDAHRAWVELAMRRKQELEDGIVTPVSADEAYARVRARLRG
jgi:hypothetical protein